jgi:hypothetical protein
MISQYFNARPKEATEISSHKSFSSSRNGSCAAPESGIRTAANGQSFTKYAQRADANYTKETDLGGKNVDGSSTTEAHELENVTVQKQTARIEQTFGSIVAGNRGSR